MSNIDAIAWRRRCTALHVYSEHRLRQQRVAIERSIRIEYPDYERSSANAQRFERDVDLLELYPDDSVLLEQVNVLDRALGSQSFAPPGESISPQQAVALGSHNLQDPIDREYFDRGVWTAFEDSKPSEQQETIRALYDQRFAWKISECSHTPNQKDLDLCEEEWDILMAELYPPTEEASTVAETENAIRVGSASAQSSGDQNVAVRHTGHGASTSS
jgi:hypothetical protein